MCTIFRRAIIRGHATTIVHAFKHKTFVRNFVIAVAIVRIVSLDAVAKPNVILNNVHAIWQSENVIQTCVTRVEQVNSI